MMRVGQPHQLVLGGRCRSGAHEWIPANIYVNPCNGKKACIPCRDAAKNRWLNRNRKYVPVEPEVTLIPARTDRDLNRSRIPRDFWKRLIARVALMVPYDQELCCKFPTGMSYRADDSGLRWAATKAGVEIGTEWRMDERCVYVWLIRVLRRTV